MNQRAYLDNHILPAFKAIKLSAIRFSHIERWLRDLRQSGMSDSAVNHLPLYTADHVVRGSANEVDPL
jgi:hypothetical protein